MNEITNMKRSRAEIVREYVPVDEQPIHGVTFDGERVWFARDGELVAFDPGKGEVVHRLPLESAKGGTAFDGTHVYQLSKDHILVVDPASGTIVRRMPAPEKGLNSGLAYADGFLWIGQYSGKKIHKVDAKTGEIVKTLASDRFVTGVSFVSGALWHAAAGDGQTPELRRLAADGTVEEAFEVPVGMIAGMERTPSGDFWCAGEKGRLRLVRKRAG